MPTETITRRFDVAAPPGRVWTYLTTPELVVTCLPGATLVSSSEDGLHHEGTVVVKLGALSISYRGVAEFVEVDDETRRCRVSAKGREKTGAGSAEMKMEADVHPSDRGCEVALEITMSVTGKIVTLGRGMIGIVSEQVISEFVTCLSKRFEDGDVRAAPAGVETSPTGAGDHAVAGEADAAASAPADGLGLLWRALRSWLARIFGGG
jgi:carbon monoxide dehydrogenase subunit G